jgi:hypothetical protein
MSLLPTLVQLLVVACCGLWQHVAELPLSQVYLARVSFASLSWPANSCYHMFSHVSCAGNPPNLVQQIVDLSMASGVTSAHTAMVGFETTPQRYEQMQVGLLWSTAQYHPC